MARVCECLRVLCSTHMRTELILVNAKHVMQTTTQVDQWYRGVMSLNPTAIANLPGHCLKRSLYGTKESQDCLYNDNQRKSKSCAGI